MRVHAVKDKTIVVDFNHPLAGETLNFDLCRNKSCAALSN